MGWISFLQITRSNRKTNFSDSQCRAQCAHAPPYILYRAITNVTFPLIWVKKKIKLFRKGYICIWEDNVSKVAIHEMSHFPSFLNSDTYGNSFMRSRTSFSKMSMFAKYKHILLTTGKQLQIMFKNWTFPKLINLLTNCIAPRLALVEKVKLAKDSFQKKTHKLKNWKSLRTRVF